MRGCAPGHAPPILNNKSPLTLPSRYVFLSSAYPFSACSNRQPFGFWFTKGYAYLFPISTPFGYNSKFIRGDHGKPGKADTKRGAPRSEVDGWKADPAKPYAHPYYWGRSSSWEIGSEQ
jgi:hypothetical protein